MKSSKAQLSRVAQLGGILFGTPILPEITLLANQIIKSL